ncbi:spermidine/putrescine ABC transporter substrate-binding protein [Hylemonella gracilis str. Niagara R]|uniref:Putrescine-binding periplasmic protein n=1 Tax=Hylemonella gracilis str. Niagara R TaxID=1458275 RepID=A0A016XCX2_9BURK|nr:polyamine ABC transporter substrate-binding protein [Hylemonella gracilis]EYC49944.1 spermidine/putrescine ABC transporter substrate-binding protein [Hylemonella gracilis str. Niagara R]
MKLKFRSCSALATVAATLISSAALLWGTSAAAQGTKVLNIYNWSDYIADDTIANFEKETGIKVRYDNFDNNEIVHAKLVAGKTGYDIVVPTSNWAALQLSAGLFTPLDRSKIPNLKNLDAPLMAQLASVDPGNQHLVPWLWGYTTVGINVDKVKKAIGGELPANVWDLIFKPEYVSKLRSCGVSVLDSADEVVPAALHYLGKPRVSRNAADYNAALALLKSIRPHVTLFSSSGYINDMASGSICLALGWSGDINIARQRAIDNKTGQNIQALVPSTGGLLFFDVMAIPADAPNVENAYKFIDYILRPQVNAGLTNKVFYPNGTYAVSKPYINPAVANNSSVFLSAADMGKMVGFADQQLTNEIRRNQNRVYTAFKTGM